MIRRLRPRPIHFTHGPEVHLMNSIASEKILIIRENIMISGPHDIKSTDRVFQKAGTMLHHWPVPRMTPRVYPIPPLEFKVHCRSDPILLHHALLDRCPRTLLHAGLIADDPAICRLVALVFGLLWLSVALGVWVILIVWRNTIAIIVVLVRLHRFWCAWICGAITSLPFVTTHFSRVTTYGTVLDSTSALVVFTVLLLIPMMIHKIE